MVIAGRSPSFDSGNNIARPGIKSTIATIAMAIPAPSAIFLPEVLLVAVGLKLLIVPHLLHEEK